MKDQLFIFLSAGFRAIAVSFSGVILGMYLSSLQFGPALMGLAISLGLAGCAAGTLFVTLIGNRIQRRTMLFVITFLMACGGLCLIYVHETRMIFAAFFFGMVNGMGRDRGASQAIEQAMLPQTTFDEHRTKIFAWYNVVVDSGHAIGALLGGLPAFLRSGWGFSLVSSYQAAWIFYSSLCLISGLIVMQISKGVELKRKITTHKLSAASRPLVMKFAFLSGLDSLGGGFLTTAIVSYWFFKRFGVDEAFLGPLFFFVRIANGISHLGAAWLAKRIGLVNTMVFTHLPSSFLLMTVPFAPNLAVAVLLFLIRELLVEMDVPTRQSYLVAIVKEEERTKAAGIVTLTRNVAWAIAPATAGSFMGMIGLSMPLIFGPGLKIVYDILLYQSFRHIKPPEEKDKNRSRIQDS